jgi:hypothetical protein
MPYFIAFFKKSKNTVVDKTVCVRKQANSLHCEFI